MSTVRDIIRDIIEEETDATIDSYNRRIERNNEAIAKLKNDNSRSRDKASRELNSEDHVGAAKERVDIAENNEKIAQLEEANRELRAQKKKYSDDKTIKKINDSQ
jgi:hypothetical protein